MPLVPVARVLLGAVECEDYGLLGRGSVSKVQNTRLLPVCLLEHSTGPGKQRSPHSFSISAAIQLNKDLLSTYNVLSTV